MCAGLEVCRVCRIRWIESLAVFGVWRSCAFSCLSAPSLLLPVARIFFPCTSLFCTSASSLLPLSLRRLCLLLLSLIPGRLYASTPWRGILSQAIFNPFHVLCSLLPSTSSFSRSFLRPLSAPPLSVPLGDGVVSVSSYRRANGIYRLGLPGVLRRAMHPIRSMWRWVAAVGRACGCGSRWRRPSRSRAVCG